VAEEYLLTAFCTKKLAACMGKLLGNWRRTEEGACNYALFTAQKEGCKLGR
jgi:hypothetical protein